MKFFTVFISAVAIGISSAACSTTNSLDTEPSQTTDTLYVAEHGWHAGVVLRKSSIPDGLLPEHRDFPNSVFIEVGWGDAGYYQADEVRLGLIIAAAFWPTASVLHVEGVRRSLAARYRNLEVVMIVLPRDRFRRVVTNIDGYFRRDGAPKARQLGPGLFANSYFYPAKTRYHLFHNCNHWVAGVLEKAGCPLNPIFSMTVGMLMQQARRCGTVLD